MIRPATDDEICRAVAALVAAGEYLDTMLGVANTRRECGGQFRLS